MSGIVSVFHACLQNVYTRKRCGITVIVDATTMRSCRLELYKQRPGISDAFQSGKMAAHIFVFHHTQKSLTYSIRMSAAIVKSRERGN